MRYLGSSLGHELRQQVAVVVVEFVVLERPIEDLAVHQRPADKLVDGHLEVPEHYADWDQLHHHYGAAVNELLCECYLDRVRQLWHRHRERQKSGCCKTHTRTLRQPMNSTGPTMGDLPVCPSRTTLRRCKGSGEWRESMHREHLGID